MSHNLFEGSRVRLRALESSDADFFYQWNFDTDFARLDYEVVFPQSSEQVKTWLESITRHPSASDNFYFMIETLNGKPVGTINTHHCNPRHGTFMYGIGIQEQHHRKGYASEAIRLALRYFFEEKRYQKVNVEVYSFNQPSMQLHERLGFSREGQLRRMVYTRGIYQDLLVYGMTFEEFQASETSLAGKPAL